MCRPLGWIAAPLGVLGLAHGVYMTATPEAWYWLVPGVPDRGPFNQHFVRDIGITYMVIGVGFIVGVVDPHHRRALWWASTAWLAAHALFHFWEVFVGICGPESLVVDFAGVTLPALLGMALIYADRHR